MKLEKIQKKTLLANSLYYIWRHQKVSNHTVKSVAVFVEKIQQLIHVIKVTLTQYNVKANFQIIFISKHDKLFQYT